MNEIIEVVGVLSRVPELAVLPEGSEASGDDAEVMEYDSPSLIPTSQVSLLQWLMCRRNSLTCRKSITS